MKKKLAFSFMILLLLLSAKMTAQENTGKTIEKELKGAITISGAWALYPMVVKWGEEFQKIHPRIRIDISAGGAGKGMADALANTVDIGMVSRGIYPEEIKKGAWWISVTKDAVVPTINQKNPFIKKLLASGVKKETFIKIWITETIKNWKDITGTGKSASIHVYTRSDACGAAEVWAEFLGKKQEDLQGVGVYGDPGLADAVVNDILGIGFNNINYAYDPNTEKQIQGIQVLPIDLDGSGKIEKAEDFYLDRDQIMDAIAQGKYPSPPARDLHLVFQGKPTKGPVIKFIKWILADGQKYVPEAGYINLSKEKIQEELKKLGE